MKKVKDVSIYPLYKKGLFYRTNGIKSICGYEIELNLPLNFKQVEKIIKEVVDSCKRDNRPLSEERKVVMFGRMITFRKYYSLIDKNTSVWRMILNDANGLHPDEENCDPLFKKQLSKDNDGYGIND